MRVDLLRDLGRDWQNEAGVLRRRGAPVQAEVLEGCARELDERVDSWLNELLSVADACAESRYSEDRLRELVREGRIPDQRDGGAGRILIRRADLPRRPGASPPSDDLSIVDDLAKALH